MADLDRDQLATGYMHPRYAESLTQFGAPRQLHRCGGWYLRRHIPSFPDHDGVGCYPLFACQDWSQLHFDLEDLADELVSLALVTDPFGSYDVRYLHLCFDVMIPFKEHFVTDLHSPISTIASKHHRYYARRALRDICVERCPDPIQFLDQWIDLYATLIRRHQVKGIKAFSRAAFARQLNTPGMVAFRAIYHGNTVGAHLWYVQENVAYSHLAAFSPLGYEVMAAYALYWFAVEHFAARELQWLNLGAGAGIRGNGTDGLSRFKRGWATGTRTAYFCGRVLDRSRYSQIVQASGVTETGYFPAYRKGEFE